MDLMELDESKTVLEIGVGTGRLAIKTAGCCRWLTGIDISPKTIERARENLQHCLNISLICDDFITHQFTETFDVVYSSLKARESDVIPVPFCFIDNIGLCEAEKNHFFAP